MSRKYISPDLYVAAQPVETSICEGSGSSFQTGFETVTEEDVFND